ncbi:MAG: trimeric intracellular cation channel family protein [Planctomycetota bacterium]|nr:trimeric intracellular cation channel family protein [Planctomycetota bacterium]
MTVLYVLDLFGVVVFAVTGALAAGRKRMDLFGVTVLALATALGGGTVRDLVLGARRVFWVDDPLYVVVGAAGAVLTFTVARLWRLPERVLLVGDAFGLAVFTVIGAGKALAMDVSPIICVLMGMMTGTVGGMIRDVLSSEIPLILRREIYATASLCGAVVYVVLATFWPGAWFSVAAAVAVVLAIRLAAIRWDLSLPTFLPSGERGEGT